MLPPEVLTYLQTNILRSQEELNHLFIEKNGLRYNIPIIKRSTRRLRRVGMLTLGLEQTDKIPPIHLVKAFSSPMVKKPLEELAEHYEWIDNGWLIRETRYDKDEKTVLRIYYRMGQTLFAYIQQVKNEDAKKWKDLLQEWLVKQKQMQGFADKEGPIQKLGQFIETIVLEIEEKIQSPSPEKIGLQRVTLFRELSWRQEKMLLFLHFLLAVFRLASSRPTFDWKEIGAVYYDKIGGSKIFDPYKEDFLTILEEVLEVPPFTFGLISLGTITPLFFAGELQGTFSDYKNGAIHATTDYEVFVGRFSSPAKVLWLVENRAVLTRMAHEQDFINSTESLVLCLDGQVKSGHKRLIRQFLQNIVVPSSIQVIVWTDYDQSGLDISRHVWNVLQPFSENISIQWILPQSFQPRIVIEYDTYVQKIANYLEKKSGEQEYDLGGPAEWKQWIREKS